jgi:hypothetical protein
MTDIINFSRKARDYLIGDNWDICFQMDSKLFSEILACLTKIDSDVPFNFYREHISTHMASYKESLCAEVEISKESFSSYNIKWRIDGENERIDYEYKLILIDFKGMVGEIGKFAKDKTKITVKIDSLETMRAEFIIENYVIWANLLNPKNFNEKRVLEISKEISDRRNNSNKAWLKMRHKSFKKICELKKKKRSVDLKVLFYVNNKDGLFITSGDKSEGRIIEILPIGSESLDNIEDSGVKAQEERKIQLIQEDGEVITGRESDAEDLPYKKRDLPKKRKRPIPNQVKDELLALKVETEQSIYINAKSFALFSQIKMHEDVIMEIITDRFIYLENHYQNVKFVLVIKAEKIELG